MYGNGAWGAEPVFIFFWQINKRNEERERERRKRRKREGGREGKGPREEEKERKVLGGNLQWGEVTHGAWPLINQGKVWGVMRSF